MAKPITLVKPKRGRPPAGGRDPFVGIRLPEDLLGRIARWSSDNHATSRSEAVRRLVELGLTVKTRHKQSNHARAERAKELAGHAIDKMGDPAAHPAEHAQRRRRLTKGPEEFREVRVDRPNTKGSPK
jgi:Arc/MetJ-type ribon-helix-helix transcriptional regulator